MRLKDKVALVTGAGSGIGKAIALRFAAEASMCGLSVRAPGAGRSKAAQRLQSLRQIRSAYAPWRESSIHRRSAIIRKRPCREASTRKGRSGRRVSISRRSGAVFAKGMVGAPYRLGIGWLADRKFPGSRQLLPV